MAATLVADARGLGVAVGAIAHGIGNARAVGL
jgi:hypothetical protein